MRIFLEKIPLVILSMLDAVVTLRVQRETIRYSEPLPLVWRVGNALDSYLAYVGQMFWPAKLAVFYPHTADRLPLWHILLTFLVLGAITFLALGLRRTRPYLVIGWSWYLICLLPVIGFIQVGLQGRADRYTYLPQIGLYIALTWAVSELSFPARPRRLLLPGLAAAAVALLSWQAWMQASFWSDTESLWKHALAVTQDSDVAHNNVAGLLAGRGKLDEAIWHYQEAVRLQSDTRETHYHLSVALLHNSLANALAQKGRTDEAIAHYRKAVQLRDDFADAHCNLAALLAEKGQTVEAIAHYEKALALPPEDSASHLALAKLFLKTGKISDALVHFRRALEIAPDSDVVLNACAWVLATNPDATARNGREAVKLAEKASRLNGGQNPEVMRTLAASYAEAGQYSQAVEAAQQALRLTRHPPLARALEEEVQIYRQGKAYGR
jgi:tetratricopeptide (TPR) repeat protein